MNTAVTQAPVASEPRSIRLNQSHRTDMIDAVMKQWVTTNPCPTKNVWQDFIKTALSKYKKVPKSAPEEHRNLMQVIASTEQAKAAQEAYPEVFKSGSASISRLSMFVIQVKNDANENLSYTEFMLPVKLAQELGIPYFTTTTLSISSHEVRSYELDKRFPEYFYTKETSSSGDNRYIDIAVMAHSGYRCTLVIPDSFAGYRDMKKSERLRRKWEEEQRRMREEISDYLSQFNTTKQIRDGWPEMVQYLPAHIADPASVIKLPALTRSRLNERLGI